MKKSNLQEKIINNYKEIIKKLNKMQIIYEPNDLVISKTSEGVKLSIKKDSNYSNIIYDMSIKPQDLYNKLNEKRQFNFKFKDGSILQYECTILGNKIKKERIFFLKVYNYTSNKDLLDLDYFQMGDEGNLMQFPFIIRFDYDPDSKDNDHPAAHLTLCNIQSCRIAMKSNISLGEFLEFILKQVYNIKIDLPTMSNEETITKDELKKIHLNWNL